MKIITLIENNVNSKSELICEFGLSLYIEDDDFKLIFDTGQSGIFTENIKKLKIKPLEVHNIILSHNHYDHVGGLKTYINNFGNNFTLHVHKDFFNLKYSLTSLVSRILSPKYLENFVKNKNIPINFINVHIHKLSKNISLFTNFSTKNLENKSSYFKKLNNTFIKDSFEDEIVLGLDTKKGFILVCGCSHIGIENIIKDIQCWTGKKVNGVIGGLHLSKVSDDDLNRVVNFFKENNINYFAISHCSGNKIITKLKAIGAEIISNNTGDIILI